MFERVIERSPAPIGSLRVGSTYEQRSKVDKYRPETDQRILECFRRSNLDAFWSRGTETVKGNALLFDRILLHGERTGARMFEPPPGKERRDVGERCALAMMLDSLEPGRHEQTVKFSSVRKVRSVFTNVLTVHGELGAPAQAMRNGMKVFHLTSLPTDSVWFQAVMSGMRARMGERLKQDMALTPEIILAALRLYEVDWTAAVSHDDLNAMMLAAEGACFFVLTYAAGLRGFEVPKVVYPIHFDLQGPDHPPYIGLPLTGHFKSRGMGIVNILMFLVQTTSSGIETGLWLRRLIDVRARQGTDRGWLFADELGVPRKTGWFSEGFYRKLEEVFDSRPELFVAGVDVLEDFGPIRSGRRGATTRATKMLKGDRDQLDWFFRWNTGGGETSCVPMRVLYAERRLLVALYLHVSQIL
jgi:hypothetical protein